MNTKRDPKEIAETILERSECGVQVGAVLSDSYSVFSWGWNSPGPTGFGLHAEDHCIQRAMLRRRPGSTLHVAARWRHTGKVVTGKPCLDCQRLIKKAKIGSTFYRDSGGVWQKL